MSFPAKLLIGAITAAIVLFSVVAFVTHAEDPDEYPPADAPAIQKQDRDFEDIEDPGLCDENSELDECPNNRSGEGFLD